MLAGILARAEMLPLLLVVALLVGEPMARITGVRWLLAGAARLAAWFERKLNREKRGVATRLYRGMVALALLLALAGGLGFALTRAHPAAHWASLLLVIAVLGEGMGGWRKLRQWRAEKAVSEAVELPGLAFRFADHHGLLRYAMLNEAERFAVQAVGASLWYALGGVAAMVMYLALAAAALRAAPVFGWAARGLFALADAPAKALAALLLTLAALFVSGAKPLAALRARHFYGLIAALADCSLGGTLPHGRELPWEGRGTAKVTCTHFARTCLLMGVAVVLLVLVLGVVSH